MRNDPETELMFGANIPITPPADYLALAPYFRDEAWDEMDEYFQSHPSIYDTDFNFDGLMFPHEWSIARAAAGFCVIVHQIGTESEIPEWYSALSGLRGSVELVNDPNDPLIYAQLGKDKFAYLISRFELACQLFEGRGSELVVEHFVRGEIGWNEIAIVRLREELDRIS